MTSVRKSLGSKVWFSRGPSLLKGPSFNATKAPFDDINLRKAIGLYGDREAGIELVWGGYATVSGLGWPGSPWANPEVLTWPGYNQATKAKDQADAKKLLAQSGLAGTKIEITCNVNYVPDCEFTEGQMRAMGLDPFIKVVDLNLLSELGQAGRFTLQVTGNNSPSIPSLFGSWITTNPLNTYKHGDTKIDDYAKQFTEAIDPKLRQKIWFDAERYILQEKVYYAAYYREVFIVGYRTHIKGVWVPGTDTDETQFDVTWIDNSAR